MSVEVFNLIGAVCLLVGISLTAIAALGLFRFHELFARMHAASKPQLLGLTIICLGLCLTLRTWHWVLICTVVIAIQLLAAPVASHLLGRTAYRTGIADLSTLSVDELNQAAQRDSGEDQPR